MTSFPRRRSSVCGFARTPPGRFSCRARTRPSGRRSGFSGSGPRTCCRSPGRIPDFPIVLETVRECLDDDLDLPRLRRLLEAIQSGEVRVQTRRGEIPSPFTSELIFEFTAAHLYEWDEPKRGDLPPAGSICQRPDARAAAARRALRPIGSIRRRSAGWRTGCGITDCRREPSRRWPSD